MTPPVAEGEETGGVPATYLDKPLVLDLDHLGDEVALRPVPPRVDAEGLHVDPLRVHLAEAPGSDLRDARASMVVHLQPQQVVRLRDHAVRVDVDRLHAPAAHHHLAPTTDRGQLG